RSHHQVHDPAGWYDHERRVGTIEWIYGAQHCGSARATHPASAAGTSGSLHESESHDAYHFPIQKMTRTFFSLAAAAALIAAGVAAQQPDTQTPGSQSPPAPPQQPSEISTVISGAGSGAPPRFA